MNCAKRKRSTKILARAPILTQIYTKQGLCWNVNEFRSFNSGHVDVFKSKGTVSVFVWALSRMYPNGSQGPGHNGNCSFWFKRVHMTLSCSDSRFPQSESGVETYVTLLRKNAVRLSTRCQISPDRRLISWKKLWNFFPWVILRILLIIYPPFLNN